MTNSVTEAKSSWNPAHLALWLAGAALLYSLAFWRAPFIWLRADDFAWLSLWNTVEQEGWREAVLMPAAQGTVRIFSERLYFLSLSELFGITSWPFRVMAMGAWAVALLLIQRIGARLTGSAAAGIVAAGLWGISPRLFTPIAWASAFNELFLTVLVLGAFYARLRWLDSRQSRYRWIEAALYLIGFGVLELVVLYPAAVALLAITDQKTRPQWRSALVSSLWMWIPAMGFTLLHLLVIPKVDDADYARVIDARLPETLATYIGWAVGRSWVNLAWDAPLLGFLVIRPALIALGWGAGLALLGFAIRKLMQGNFTSVLLSGWFLLWLLPVLPLVNHMTEYYLTIPLIGLAWLVGWAAISAWRSGVVGKAVTAVLIAGYLMGSLAENDALGAYHLEMTGRMRLLFRAAESTMAKYPGSALVFLGINDEQWFRAGLDPNAVHLMGASRAYLPPNARELETFADFDGVPAFGTTAAALLALDQADALRALEVSGGEIRDVTEAYGHVLASLARAERAGPVQVASSTAADRLGEGWYEVENGTRWSSGRATLQLWMQPTASEVVLTGYAPPAALDAVEAGGAITISIALDGIEAGAYEVEEAGLFEAHIPVGSTAAGLGGETRLAEVTLSVEPTFRPEGDGRELGLIFNTVELR